MATNSRRSLHSLASIALFIATTVSCVSANSTTGSFENKKKIETTELQAIKEQLYSTIKVLTRLQQIQDSLLLNTKTSFMGNIGSEIGYILGAAGLGIAGTTCCLESIIGADNYKNYWSNDYYNYESQKKAQTAVMAKAYPVGVLSIIGSYILLKIIFKHVLAHSNKNDTAAIQESLAEINETLSKLTNAAKTLEQTSA